MSLSDKFLLWYQTYITEITWFLIGNICVQLAEALHRQDYADVAWCTFIIFINYSIWKRNRD